MFFFMTTGMLAYENTHPGDWDSRPPRWAHAVAKRRVFRPDGSCCYIHWIWRRDATVSPMDGAIPIRSQLY